MKNIVFRLLALAAFALASLAAFGYALGYFDLTFITR